MSTIWPVFPNYFYVFYDYAEMDKKMDGLENKLQLNISNQSR